MKHIFYYHLGKIIYLFRFSKYGYIFNRALMTHSVIFLFSSIKALSTASPFSLATIMLII